MPSPYLTMDKPNNKEIQHADGFKFAHPFEFNYAPSTQLELEGDGTIALPSRPERRHSVASHDIYWPGPSLPEQSDTAFLRNFTL
jgi:hypothetical protein